MKPNIAIVHDYLTAIGGAEMTLKSMCELWPRAPVYTLLYDFKTLPRAFIKNKIYPSFLNKLPPFFKKRKKIILPFFTVAPETFDLREFDVVVSSSGAFSKGVITKPSTLNVCYCHSPMRFAWDYTHQYLAELKTGRLKNFWARFVLNYVRLWDAVSADRADYIVANSQATRQKIRKYYRRSSVVIYPPVETELFAQSACEARKDHGYFLIVSRLSAYKKINLAVEAFNKLGWKLVIIGQGPEFKKLHRLAGPNIKLLGYQNRKKTIQYFKNCRAYIQPAEEDFGISTVEAMAAGKPVLALNQGGAREIIKPGLNGEFIQASSAEVLAQGVFKINQNRKNYNPQKIQAFAQKFSSRRFKKELKEFIQKKYYAFRDKDTNR